MKFALIHIAQETNDFNPEPTTLRDYRSFGLFEGQEILEKQRGAGMVGGYMEAVEESGLKIETVPIIRAHATAGGRIDRESLDFFARKIREGLEAAGPIDGLALQLHGACAADGLDDVEGAQAALCREILGPDVPIVLALDHHANITQLLVDSVDAMIAHLTQPHLPFDTGKRAAQLLIRVASGEVSPVMAWRKIPLLSHQEQFLTDRAPMKTWFDQSRGWEASDPKVLSVSNCPMQPWLDVAEGGWSVVAVTDGDQALAERLADESADLVWSLRDAFQEREAVAVDDAVRQADAAESGIVILSDTGDTVFGGAAGDSNVILESILRLGIRSTALIPMIAPKLVARLVEAGEGAEVTVEVGGETSGFFEPLEVTGRVRKIAGGVIQVPAHHQHEVDMGQTVIFETGPVTMLISELRGVAGNMPEAYRAFGIEPRDYKIAVLKTASNFQFFAPFSSMLIRADTKGPGQSDVFGLPWKRLPRPIYPLDPVTDWRAETR